MTTREPDPAKVEAFGEKFVDVLNHGALALATSIGHRTGLFDAMAELPPSTSEAIAEAAGLNERYVREWLGAMVTGGFVDYEPTGKRYYLPREHAACLTRAATPNNLAVFAQYIALLGTVEDKIVKCFRHGGGVPYADFPRFPEVMAEESAQTVVAALIDGILPLAPGLVKALEGGIDVLDVGCGAGRALNLLARSYPSSRFTGYDFTEAAIAMGRAEAEKDALPNVRFDIKDVTSLGESARYDLITAFDAIHDQANPAAVLRGIATALRPQGTFLMQDIAGSSHLDKNLDHPIAPLLYTISCMHCMTVSLAQNGEGLGTMWGKEKALEMLRDAGFGQVEVTQLPHDIQNNYFIATKG